MRNLSKQEIQQIFQNALDTGKVSRYKKVGKVICRPVIPGETVITIVSGKVETLLKVTDDSIVIKNIEPGSSAEQYVISNAKFNSRYEFCKKAHNIDGSRWEEAIPTGECDALVWQEGECSFLAPWGEQMHIENGDYLASPPLIVPGEIREDIYRIEKNEFYRTYAFISDLVTKVSSEPVSSPLSSDQW